MTTDTAKTMTRKNLFQKTTIISGLALLSLLPTLAFAHPGHELDGSRWLIWPFNIVWYHCTL